MINILLSVRRPFSGFIMDGQKTWELRKNKPCIPHGEHVTLWLYESGKDGEWAVIGKCRMVSYVALRHMPFGFTDQRSLRDGRTYPRLSPLLRLGHPGPRETPVPRAALVHWTDSPTAELAVYH